MEALELILFLLAAVAASSILDKFLPRLSLPIVQVALGFVVALFIHTPLEGGFDTELLLIMFIAPLHFNESRHADSGALWANRWAIGSLAVGLVFAIVITVGFTLSALLPAIPLAIAFAFGAAMGSTDAVAVHALSKDFKFGRHHKTLLEGEAFFNDVTGTVVFQAAVAVAISGTFSLMHASEEFLLDMFGGFIGGAVMGVLAWLLLEGIRRIGIDSPTLHVTLELLLPFVIYFIAKQIHIGGVIAAVAAGMMMSLLPHKHNAQMARQKLQSRSVWDTLSFILNGVIFVILGMQLPRVLSPVAEGSLGDPFVILGVVIVLTLVLEGVRFVWILGMDMVHAKSLGSKVSTCFTADSLKGTLAMAFAGPKGGITLSLMLTLPLTLQAGEAFAARGTLISVASGVILCTLLLANFAVPLLVPHKNVARKMRDNVDAEIRVIERTIGSIMEDAHMTGSVKGNEPLSLTAHHVSADEVEAENVIQEIDEPATVIVMHRYAEQLEELIGHASPEAAEHAQKIIDKCDALYEAIDDIGNQIDDMEDADDDSGISVTGHFRQLRQIYEAVEDVQAQALARELEIIKSMRDEGALSSEQAKELRNDVYIQQLTL